MRDLIEIRGLDVDCVVGVYPRERDVPQRLRLDVALEVDTERAAVEERLRESIDYSATAAQIAFVLQSCRFRLVETAAHVLAKLLLAPPAPGERRVPVARVRLTLTKPDALGRHAVPSLTIEREAAWVRMACERKPWGSVDVLHETRDAGLYRLNVAPGQGIPLHVHRVMRECELVLSEGLLCQGVPAPSGSVFRWPHDAPHRYDNPTDRWQTILCVDAPPFLPSDEIEVQGAPAPIAPEQAWERLPEVSA
jgi:dihydroneopterin aldolase